MERAFLVLGMHRSGTSALTRTLNLLGLFVPQEKMHAAQADNPKGYWEHTEIIRAHERFFHALGYGIYGPVGPWNDAVWSSAEASALSTALREIVTRDLVGHGNWLMKEPRTCRLLPLWLPLLDALGVDTSIILVARDPSEVAASLGAREDMPEVVSDLLWLAHTLDAEVCTRGRRRIVVTYDQLMNDFRGTADAIAHGLEIDLPLTPDAARQLEGFLDVGLRHHRVPPAPAANAPARELALRVWQALGTATGGTGAMLQTELDAAHREWRNIWDSPHGTSSARACDALLERLQHYKSAYHERERGVRDLEGQLRGVLTSKSWRWTAALRALRSAGRPR